MPQINASQQLLTTLQDLKKNLEQVQTKQILPRAQILALKKYFDKNLKNDFQFIDVSDHAFHIIQQVLTHSGYISQDLAEQAQTAIQTLFDQFHQFELEKTQQELSMSQGISLFGSTNGQQGNQIDELKLELQDKNSEIEALEAEIKLIRNQKLGQVKENNTPQQRLSSFSVDQAVDPMLYQIK